MKRNEIQEQVKKLKERGNNMNTPWKEISNFGDEEFYGFCTDFEQKKEKIQDEIRKEIENKEYVMDTYGEETEEYKEARMNWEEKKMN